MSKERDIQILERKITDLTIKITNFQKFDIDDKKTQNLQMLKLKYETQLEELQLS